MAVNHLYWRRAALRASLLAPLNSWTRDPFLKNWKVGMAVIPCLPATAYVWG